MFRGDRRRERDRDRSSAPRRRVSYTNVTAVLALVIVLAGGTAYAASKIIITKTSQISASVRKALHGATGPAGAPGTAGVAGNPGAAGVPDAWAEVVPDGTITQQSGGITSTPGTSPLAYLYCLHVPGTPHVAVATPDGSEGATGTFEVTYDPASLELDTLIADGYCGPTTNVAVITITSGGADAAEPFNLLVD
jgi:hypothetical protein